MTLDELLEEIFSSAEEEQRQLVPVRVPRRESEREAPLPTEEELPVWEGPTEAYRQRERRMQP